MNFKFSLFEYRSVSVAAASSPVKNASARLRGGMRPSSATEPDAHRTRGSFAGTFRRAASAVGHVLALSVVLTGCGDPIVAEGPSSRSERPATEEPAGDTETAPASADGTAAAPLDQGVPDQGPVYEDEAFVEVGREQRDPFRDFSSEWAGPAVEPIGTTRRVELSDVSVDDMRVIGIVLGASPPRAMVVGPDGVGTAIRPRQYVGRREIVQVGGAEDGVPVQLNWRVDRIRRNEVVLTRENPQAPDQPPLQRTLVLRTDDDLEVMRLGSVAPLGEATPPLPSIP